MMIGDSPRLVGQRVTLRPYSAGLSDTELARIYRWARDPAILALAGGTPVDLPFDRFRDLFVEQLPRHNSEREQLFLIVDEAGEAIGRAGLFGLGSRFHPATGELGIVLGEPQRWGQGYGREAVRLLTDFGFGALGLDRVTLFTYPDNLRARRAFEAAGFQLVREIKRFSLDRGTHTELEMELRAGDG
jgi:RimJ/RimL family protein N-acetyltransferase